jgi:hypothetical protein
VQDARDIAAVGVEGVDELGGRVRIAQLGGHVDVAVADGVEPGGHVFLALGGRDESQQRVGDTAGGGSASRMPATRVMHAASATLEPPNL